MPEEALPEIRALMDEVAEKVDMLTNAVLDDPVLRTRLAGVGVLTKEDAIRYCVTGPTARGSDLSIDVRADEPYAAYDLVDWEVKFQSTGDVFAKAVVRLLETLEAVEIIRRCLEQMKPGEVRAEVREVPEGEGIGHAEAPRGETFHYVRGNGTNYPERYKVRAPTYVNLPSFKANVIGAELADAMLIVAAMDPCYSCTERMGVVRSRALGKKEVIDKRTLIRMCQEKTERIRRQC
jgi:NADH-quinone oxidoreductase subunit D